LPSGGVQYQEENNEALFNVVYFKGSVLRRLPHQRSVPDG
jgi:hypothetical protein